MQAGPIPFVLHQIALNAQVPEHLEGFRSSWKHWNPDLEVMLWTDQSLRAFIAEQAPELLPFFDGYPHGVCRADLGRYLLLQHFGGLYSDLDCQCLQPLVPLLDGRDLVMAPEPEAHHQRQPVRVRGIRQIVGNAFLASVPAHPLWRDVLAELRRFKPAEVRTADDILEATGPLLLSRVVAAIPCCERHLIAADWIYPFSKDDCWKGRVFDPWFWSERTREAFVAHHWDGSWSRPTAGLRAGLPAQAPVSVHQPPAVHPPPPAATATSVAAPDSTQDWPLISCLMVTRGRPQLARLAIASFLKQTYPVRELVVVDDDPDPQLADWIEAQASPLLRLVRLPDEGRPLGALRNLAVDLARGEYVCQWDDDDLSDPVRLEVQLRTLLATGSQASLLARWMIWWPQSQRLALSRYRDWEGSLLCQRSRLPRFPAELRRGEDTVMLGSLLERVRLARIDMPRLYLYVVHGANTYEAAHFEAHWQVSTVRWQGEALQRLLPELQRRLPMAGYPACD